jgi:hypothetical protein
MAADPKLASARAAAAAIVVKRFIESSPFDLPTYGAEKGRIVAPFPEFVMKDCISLPPENR